jgi:hypothetical protein
MPFWVWLAFQEVPAFRALAGGALVMGAVLATSSATTGRDAERREWRSDETRAPDAAQLVRTRFRPYHDALIKCYDNSGSLA